jgi:hypothetical protein
MAPGREAKRSSSHLEAEAEAEAVMTRERSESDDWRELLCTLWPSSEVEGVGWGGDGSTCGGSSNSLPDLSDDWKGMWAGGGGGCGDEEEEEFGTTHEDDDELGGDHHLHLDSWTDAEI